MERWTSIGASFSMHRRTGDITVFSVGGFDGFALDGDFRLDGLGSVGIRS
jgi:hypothetical protein